MRSFDVPGMEFSYKERLLFLMKLATKIADRFVRNCVKCDITIFDFKNNSFVVIISRLPKSLQVKY